MKKKKVFITIIIVFLIIFVIQLPIFGRYIYNNVRDNYLKSRHFSFSSDLLANVSKTYKYANWSGLENYELAFQLFSYENEVSLFTYEGYGLNYTIKATTTDTDKVTVHLGGITGSAEQSSYIPNSTNIKDIKLFICPNEEMRVGDVITVKVTATTTTPYKKELSAEFKVQVTKQNITYSIEDESRREYAIFRVVNEKSTGNQVKISFDPQKIRLDLSNDAYINKIAFTNTTINGIKYVNGITFNIGAEQSMDIKFYKVYASENYTYPNESMEDMIINVN